MPGVFLRCRRVEECLSFPTSYCGPPRYNLTTFSIQKLIVYLIEILPVVKGNKHPYFYSLNRVFLPQKYDSDLKNGGGFGPREGCI